MAIELKMAQLFTRLKRLPVLALVFLVRTYQVTLSPYLGHQCRFHPTCSHYAIEALERRGVLRGGWLALRRLLRCHPFHPGGHDPVPSPRGAPAESRAPLTASGIKEI